MTKYVLKGNKMRQVRYCPHCCPEWRALKALKKASYVEIPCKCDSDWKKDLIKIKEKLK